MSPRDAASLARASLQKLHIRSRSNLQPPRFSTTVKIIVHKLIGIVVVKAAEAKLPPYSLLPRALVGDRKHDFPSSSTETHSAPHTPQSAILDDMSQYTPRVTTSKQQAASESTASTSSTPSVPVRPPQPKLGLLPPYRWQSRTPACRIIYIRDVAFAERELAALTAGPLGFDLEWKPNFVRGERPNPTALLQLANADCVMLFQLSAMPIFPPRLAALLADPAYAKIGVGIEKDCQKLHTDFGVPVRGCVELSYLARSVDNARWKGKFSALIGLARLCEAYERLSLPKGRVQTSNWESVLSAQQQDYAANDSHVAWSIYTKLMALAEHMLTPPLAIYYSFNIVQGRRVQLNTPLQWIPHNPDYDPGPLPEPRVSTEFGAAVDPATGEAVPLSAKHDASRTTGRKRHRPPHFPETAYATPTFRPNPSASASSSRAPRSTSTASNGGGHSSWVDAAQRAGISVKPPKQRARRTQRQPHGTDVADLSGESLAALRASLSS